MSNLSLLPLRHFPSHVSVFGSISDNVVPLVVMLSCADILDRFHDIIKSLDVSADSTNPLTALDTENNFIGCTFL